MRYLVLILSLLLIAPVQAKLYRWVDEDGNVHFSDKQPPSQAGQGRDVLDKGSGRTVERVDKAKTEVEIEAEAEAEQRLLAELERRQKQAEQDRILLMTFTSAEEMERARNNRISTIESSIELNTTRIEKLEAELAQEKRKAAQAERAGRGVPQAILDKIAQINQQIADIQSYVAQRREDRARIEAQFDQDMARFKELQGGKAVGSRPGSDAANGGS